jgi:type III restriction enzyme
LPDVVIENPVINSPYVEPERHFRFDEDGITNEIVEGRRPSSYFVPIAAPRKRGKQLAFDTEWTKDRLEQNDFVNRVRSRVASWRQNGYAGVTTVSRELLAYWNNPERERKLFFCQIEALETAIYLTEVASKVGDTWIDNWLRQRNEESNPLLLRTAFKMATGTGKTVVMAMLIAWHTLNKLANPQDARFSDVFLIVTPGITIRDRLRVLLPNDTQNYYRERDIVTPEWLERLGQAKIVITNFHGFRRREKWEGSRLGKQIAVGHRDTGAFTETPAEMVRRVCRELGNKHNIVVINDEAHHCYRRKPDSEDEALSGEDRREAEKRNEEARVWITGLEAVRQRLGVRALFDLSATPFFLRGSGYSEGVLFPWVVSDFSLIDAIESGIVKVPRVPVSDDAMTGTLPTYRELWTHIRDDLPRKGRSTAAVQGEPQLPIELEGALTALYGNYEKAYQQWFADTEAQAGGQTPPVFIVVCNNTNVSKLVFDYIAGWEKALEDGSIVLVPGALSIFSNVRDDGTWSARPNTILVDSSQLESGEAMSSEFKKVAAAEIEEFRHEIRARGGNPDEIADEDLLREVMNTVGKPGRLGEQVKCVVSVSMLTEGWDANTVTHILGVRAFGTQLLCEQVVGRALRRRSYATEPSQVNIEGASVEIEAFAPEYAEVFGVPFSFIPTAGHNPTPKLGPVPTRVRALEERINCEITFPRVVGYKWEFASGRLSARFSDASKFALSTANAPTSVENAPIVGESVTITLDELKQRREQEIAVRLAKRTLEKYFRDEESGQVQAWLFPQLLSITRSWLEECVELKDGTFKQLLLFTENAEDACDRIYSAIVASEEHERTLRPILRPYDTLGSTRYVDFDTTRPTLQTDPTKCHISHVVADTDSWEQKAAQAIEAMPEVIRYVKNQGLGFSIPYTLNGEEHQYIPDFIACIDDGHGPNDLLNVIVEVSGEAKKDKAVKVATAREFWVPAINGHDSYGRWTFVEVTDPWNTQATIRSKVGEPNRHGL